MTSGPERRAGSRRPRGGSRRPRRGPAARQVDPARRVAYDVLRAVDERDAYANLVLPALLTGQGLAGRDAALATELTYGALRGSGTYDAVIAACVDRPLDDVDPAVRDVLRLGAHQVLATRVPAHAAVATTVDLASATVGRRVVGFVNAVMRRIAGRDLAAWVAQVAPSQEADPVGYLAVAHSHPRWVVDALRDALDGDLAETEALLAADNLRPRVTLVARPGRAEVAELLALGATPAPFSPYGAVLDEGDPAALAPVRQGRAGVQDEGSQLVALALAQAPLDGDDARWLDLCAGPGGKAALLAGLAAGRGAHLLAVERQPHRARLVAGAVGRSTQVTVADGTRPAWRPGAFDRVLADVPCTGLGALRRRPEARWRRQPSDLDALAPLQRDLLRSALSSARPGGLVAYVTCSPHRAETRAVVDDVFADEAGAEGVRAELVDARPLLPGVPALGSGPDVQLWPHRHGTDAMYLALLRRL